MKKLFALSALAAAVSVVGCSDSDPAAPATYNFTSQFEAGESSVSYSGQTARQVLISDLKTLIADDFASAGDAATVIAELNALYDADTGSDIDNTTYLLSKTDQELTPGPTYGDISTGKDLKGKIAGEDNLLRHETLRGWTTGLDADPTPDEFVQYLFQLVADNAVNQSVRTGTDGETLPPYVTASGVDVQQLSNKFLLMAVAYSQGTGDYLSDDLLNTDGTIASKGLNASNTQAEGKNYTSLEHAWDEGFGYFGAARDYLYYTDAEIRAHSSVDGQPRGEGYYDTDGDGLIDLRSEINFAAAVNAAKRDFGSADAAKTDFTTSIFNAFYEGRRLITEQPSGYMDALRVQRDIAVNGWEKVYAATAVHYINDTLQDMNKFGTDDYSFLDHAKHWSELKGFVMGLQFNPNALITIGQVEAISNTHLGDAPVLSTASQEDIDAYKASLLAARDILQNAYSFADENMGDENGEGGW